MHIWLAYMLLRAVKLSLYYLHIFIFLFGVLRWNVQRGQTIKTYWSLQ